MKDRKNVFLSPSVMRIFNSCPRCFWFHIKTKHKVNRYPFPSLASGMDVVIKNYFDVYRDKDLLPPEIDGQITGKLIDGEIMDKWRNWRTGLQYEIEDGITVIGALDECIVDDDNNYIPVDYKTRGFENTEKGNYHYQTQLDIYGFLLEKNGYITKGKGYLVYYYPSKVIEEGIIKFGTDVVEVKISQDRALSVLEKAIEVINNEFPPNAKKRCILCKWQQEDSADEAIIHI